MPYISGDRRNSVVYEYDGRGLQTAGELNYKLTKLIQGYLGYWELDFKLSYEQLALITGVLENVKQEFYRRVAEPYEDLKIKENGDVYHG